MNQHCLTVDKPYGVTADGKVVAPSHPLCRQILSHFNGQEVPITMLEKAGLTAQSNGKISFAPKEYDEVEIPSEYQSGAEQGTSAPGASAPGTVTLTEEGLQKLLQDAAAAGATAALAAVAKK